MANEKIINKITDKNIFGIEKTSLNNPSNRKAVRVIISREDGKIALLYSKSHKFHKLPGGGIEPNEDKISALNREVLEEFGISIKNIKELGITIEEKQKHNQQQISYCYTAKLLEKLKEPELTEAEQDLGFVQQWISPKEAINKLREDSPEDYTAKFIVKRDLSIIKEALNKKQINQPKTSLKNQNL